MQFSPGELLLRLYGEIKSLLPVPSFDFRSGMDFSEMAEDVCMAAVRQMRSDEEAGFTGATIESLIQFQMNKLFGGLQVSMGELSSAQQEALISKIKDYLTRLPADQQKFIMNKLGTSEITESVIRKAIANGTMWAAFAAAVQFFGFAFYTTAAQVLAFVSLNMLPFGAYAGLSSLIAVFANPLFLVLMAGVGVYFVGRKNTQIKQSMVPLVVTSLCLAGMEKQADAPAYRTEVLEQALNLWADARGKRDIYRAKESECKETLTLRQRELADLQGRLATEKNRLSGAESNVSSLTASLERTVYSSVASIEAGNWGPNLVCPARRVQAAQSRADRSWEGVSRAQGVWDTLVNAAKAPFIAWENASHLENAKKALLELVEVSSLEPGPSTVTPRTIIAERAESMKVAEEAKREVAQLEFMVRTKKGNVSNAQSAYDTARSAREKSEQKYAGLGDC
jgi:hypothetical protein